MTHGSLTAYVKHRCRCEQCRAFMSSYKKAERKRTYVPKARRPKAHGSMTVYNEGCRCELCRRAASDYGVLHRRNGRGHNISRYRKGCRCERCRRCWSAACRRQRWKKGWRPRERVGHGASRYRWYGCRCKVCCASTYEASKKYRVHSEPRSPIMPFIPALLTAPDVLTVIACEMAEIAKRMCRGAQFDELVSIAYLYPGSPESIAKRWRQDTEGWIRRHAEWEV